MMPAAPAASGREAIRISVRKEMAAMALRKSRFFSAGGFRQLIVAAGVVFFAAVAAAPAHNERSQAGATCVGVVLPSVNGIEGDATSMGSVVRELFTSYLKGPSVQVLELEARLTSQAMAEARQKNCGHVLLATVTRKRGGGSAFGKIMGGAAGAAAWSIPGGGSVGSAVARGAAWGATQAVASLAASTKAKDEMRLEYRLSSPDGATTLGPATEKRKAKADGEDILTPLVEKAAEAIVGSISKT
jgi:hypothetical protein